MVDNTRGSDLNLFYAPKIYLIMMHDPFVLLDIASTNDSICLRPAMCMCWAQYFLDKATSFSINPSGWLLSFNAITI